MCARNESRTGDFCEIETGGNEDTTVTSDVMFGFMLGLLHVQNTFCRSGAEPVQYVDPFITY